MQAPKLFLVFSVIVLGLSGVKMKSPSQKKVVLITGASSGIGLATACAFQKKGWKVWAGYRKQIPHELQTINDITLCPLDVTNDKMIQAALKKILKEDGRIDALINNAGYGLIGTEECVSIKEAQQIFDVNFFGALRLIQAVLPTMRAQQSGHIINISSAVGIQSFPGLGIYSASKFALEGLSESLAATVSPWNVKVSIVEPGFVNTAFGKNCVVGSRTCNEDVYQKISKEIKTMVTTPQGQTPDEITNLLVKIATTAQPDLRYQTSKDIKDYVAEKLVDPIGNLAQKENIKFLNSLIKQEQNHPEIIDTEASQDFHTPSALLQD